MKTSQKPIRWRERLAAEGWKPETILFMVQIFSEMVDWAKAYQAAPEFLAGIVRQFDPTITLQVPTEEKSFGLWLRHTMEKVDGVMKGLARLTDPTTGMVSEEAMRTKELKAVRESVETHVDQIRVEFKAGVDNLMALVLWGQPMSQLLSAAESGDDTALLRVLQLNRLLVHRVPITRRLQHAIQAQDPRILQDMQHHLYRRPTLHRQAKVGFTLLMLWEVGLKRLTYKQIRGFLKTAGLPNVPSHDALARYGERLGLKKYTIEPPTA